MSIGLTILIASLVALSPIVAKSVIAFRRRRETPEDLRGDWWGAFEADFRAYARNHARTQPTRGRGPSHGRQTPRGRGERHGRGPIRGGDPTAGGETPIDERRGGGTWAS